MAAAGLLAAPLPPDCGGNGLGTSPGTTLPLLDVLRRVGYGNLSLGRLYEGHVNALQLVHAYGTAEQLHKVAAGVQEGRMFGV